MGRTWKHPGCTTVRRACTDQRTCSVYRRTSSVYTCTRVMKTWLGDSWNCTRTFIMYVSTCTLSDVTAINVRALICTWNVTCTLNIIKCRYLHSTTEIFQRPPTAVLLWFLIPFRMEYNFFTDHLIERRKETNLWWVVSHVPSTTVHTSSTEKATYSRSLRVRY